MPTPCHLVGALQVAGTCAGWGPTPLPDGARDFSERPRHIHRPQPGVFDGVRGAAVRASRGLRRRAGSASSRPAASSLVAGHQVAVAVERDRDRGVAHVGGERLGVDAGGDHQRGEGVAALVEGDRRERPRLALPTRREPAWCRLEGANGWAACGRRRASSGGRGAGGARPGAPRSTAAIGTVRRRRGSWSRSRPPCRPRLDGG